MSMFGLLVVAVLVFYVIPTVFSEVGAYRRGWAEEQNRLRASQARLQARADSMPPPERLWTHRDVLDGLPDHVQEALR